MIRLLLTFFILFIAVTLGIQLNKDPGYILIAIDHWTIETTLWVAGLFLLILFSVLYLFISLCKKIFHTPRALAQWNTKRLIHKAQMITRKGLIEYSEGYWQNAKEHLIQALPNTDTPLLNYLIAARAAQKIGDNNLRDNYLREAQQLMPEAKIAVKLTQAELQLANHQWEQALATLKHLHDLAPRHPYVLKLIIQLYKEVKDWPQLIALLPDLKKYHVIEPQEYELLQYHVFLQRLIELIKQNQPEVVNTFFNSLPKSLSTNPTIIAEYIRFLLKNNNFAPAKDLLTRSLRKNFHPQLIELYSLLPSEENQLVFAEALLKKNAHSSTLYLCLGQLCIKRQLWGKAKHYLEKSLELEPTALAYKIQGDLYETLGEKFLACNSYKQGLFLITK